MEKSVAVGSDDLGIATHRMPVTLVHHKKVTRRIREGPIVRKVPRTPDYIVDTMGYDSVDVESLAESIVEGTQIAIYPDDMLLAVSESVFYR